MPNILRHFAMRTLRKMRWLPPKFYVQCHYEYFSGKKMDLENPVEFNEKLEWYKVFFHPRILNQLADKYAVRAYIEEKIGSEYLNELYGVYKKGEEIPFDELPDRFVIKATHASGFNIIVRDKANLDREKTIKKLNKWLGINQYYRKGQEWAYKDIEPRIVVEKFLEEEGRSFLVDYKFYCFNGEIKFFTAHLDRFTGHNHTTYDVDFNLLPFGHETLHDNEAEAIEKPSNLSEMIRLATKLSENLPFVRVDFYSIDGKTIFGELTLYPADARLKWLPEKYNKIIGDYFVLPELNDRKEPITKFP